MAFWFDLTQRLTTCNRGEPPWLCLGWGEGRFDRFCDFLDEIGFILIDKRFKALEDGVGDIDVGECVVQEVGYTSLQSPTLDSYNSVPGSREHLLFGTLSFQETLFRTMLSLYRNSNPYKRDSPCEYWDNSSLNLSSCVGGVAKKQKQTLTQMKSFRIIISWLTP